MLSRSFFLFGPRGTGKSTFLKTLALGENPLWINLLDPATELAFFQNPGVLAEIWKNHGTPGPESWVVIDEVQRVPGVLNVVHQMIEEHHVRFALTGSSARQLKRGAANLLAGRALLNHLHPLTWQELNADFDLNHYLQWGGLPTIWANTKNDLERTEYLKAYAFTYLKEEIQQEQIVRKVPLFRRFLEVAAQMNGKVINASKIGREVGADNTGVMRFYQILEDTLLGFFLEPYHRSLRKRLARRPKFYFFDLGVCRALTGMSSIAPVPQTSSYGESFEHFVMTQAHALNELRRHNYGFSFVQVGDTPEVDLVVSRPGKSTLFVEIKSSERVDSVEIEKVARSAAKEKDTEAWILSRESQARVASGVRVYPWAEGLEAIFPKPA